MRIFEALERNLAWRVFRHAKAIGDIFSYFGLWAWGISVAALVAGAVMTWIANLPIWGKVIVGLLTLLLVLLVAAVFSIWRSHNLPNQPPKVIPRSGGRMKDIVGVFVICGALVLAAIISARPHASIQSQARQGTTQPTAPDSVVSNNQQGGQTAGTIINYPPPAQKPLPPRPDLYLQAFLGAEGRLPDHFAGIDWNNPAYNQLLVDVRLNITNASKTDIDNMDFMIQLNTSIAGIGQASVVPDVTYRTPPSQFNLIGIEVNDDKGNLIDIPTSPSNGLGAIYPSARTFCPKLLSGETLELVIASIAINLAGGKLPQSLFPPRRDPISITVNGQYETGPIDGQQRYPIKYSMVLGREKKGNF